LERGMYRPGSLTEGGKTQITPKENGVGVKNRGQKEFFSRDFAANNHSNAREYGSGQRGVTAAFTSSGTEGRNLIVPEEWHKGEKI